MPIVETTKRKTPPRKKKPDVSQMEAMSEKYLPTSGLIFEKHVTVKNDEVVVNYHVKGDQSVIRFLEYRIFDGVCMISDAITFEMVPYNEKGDMVTVIKNSRKFPFITDVFSMMVAEPSLISIKQKLDHLLEIEISFKETSIDASDLHILWAIEYVLSSAIENFDNIKLMLDVSKRVMLGEEPIDNAISGFEKNLISDAYLLLSRDDYKAMNDNNDDENEEETNE